MWVDSYTNLYFAGFPETRQGKEETRTGKNKGNIWDQQRQVVIERATVKRVFNLLGT